MSVKQTIENKITAGLSPVHLEVINESHRHSVPPGSESHFKLVVVSDAFDGATLVRRHQTVNRILAEEFAAGLHALSLETLTAGEWRRRQGRTTDSPPCLGGGKNDA